MSNIIVQLKNGDERVFEQVYKEYYARLFHYLKGYIDETEEIKDIVQNAFISLWNNRMTLSDDDSHICSWLFTVVKNQCLNYIRDKESRLRIQSRIEFLESEKLRWQAQSLHAFIPESINLSELQQRVENAVKGMPEQCRRIYLLSREDGLSHKEISLRLNISPKTVESQITKALRILRSKFNDYYFFFICLFFFKVIFLHFSVGDLLFLRVL